MFSLNHLNKKSLRKDFLEKRQIFLSDENKKKDLEQKFCSKILSLNLSKDQPIFGYWAFGFEPDLSSFFYRASSLGYTLALPKVLDSKVMDFFRWTPHTPMEKGPFGILEPKNTDRIFDKESNKEKQKAVILTPALAIDQKGGRLGYGGGFYDRWYAQNPHHTYIGVVWSFCLSAEDLPHEPWDLRLTSWITED